MIKTCISKGWKLNAPGSEEWINVDLPNDYAITIPRTPDAPGAGGNGYFQGGIGVYEKYLTFDEKPKHYILDIDGAYMCANVNLNGYQLIMHPHGYTPLLVDLTKRAKFGEENKLQISTNGLQPSTRWYSGAGLYRDVFLWSGGDIRIEPRDVFVTTPDIYGTVKADYWISADREAEIKVSAIITDADGIIVSSGETVVSVKADIKTAVQLQFRVDSPHIWDTEHPYLYKLQTTLLESDIVCDLSTVTFGIRTISADAENGLLLNGKQIKLRGGCIHHDHGVLGVADFPAACRRKLEILKTAGFNALRIAHNPASLQLLELCDSMGIIVMEEAFDCWRLPKGGMLNYHMWFEDWWARDIQYMVLRDRNHPCVFSYSIGNEVPESKGNCDGDEWSEKLSAEIRKYDNTRLVTSATCQFGDVAGFPERTKGYFAPLDICGYNYRYTHYDVDHELFPDRVIWGSETHALRFYDSWNSVLNSNYVIGDFTWTAYDNLGETGTGRFLWARDGKMPKKLAVTEYPWRSCYQGDHDLCGHRRPQSYFREAVWIGNTEPRIFTTHPEHYGEGFSGTGWHWYDVLDSWTFDDEYIGKPVKCEVYTDADEIEWFLNGKSLGRSVPVKAIAVFDIPYEKGCISVIAYKNGQECGHSSLHTVGAPSAVRVQAETESLIADNRDLCYFDIAVTDSNGDRVPDARCALSCLVDGGELLGIFSGDPKNEDQYGSNSCHAFEGRAVAIVRSSTPGKLTVTVGGTGLASGTAEICKE